jgi:hypothetical protein
MQRETVKLQMYVIFNLSQKKNKEKEFQSSFI